MPSEPQATSLPRHAMHVRIYYEDTDAGGVVYYANYLKYFERCRTELFRSCGIEQEVLLRDGFGFVVRRAEIEYRAPARLEDELRIGTEIESLQGASMWFKQRATRANQPIADARVQVVCVDMKRGKAAAVPERIIAALTNSNRANNDISSITA